MFISPHRSDKAEVVETKQSGVKREVLLTHTVMSDAFWTCQGVVVLFESTSAGKMCPRLLLGDKSQGFLYIGLFFNKTSKYLSVF